MSVSPILGTVIVLMPVPVLIYAGNPAVALLLGIAASLAINSQYSMTPAPFSKYFLQTAIVFLGLKVNASQLINLSADYSLLVTAYVLVTLALGIGIGYCVRSEWKSSQLISSGTAICGGTTIASLSPIINAKPEQTAVALTLVFLLNAVALLTYPSIGEFFALSQEQFGVWCALSIHDTSSVVATALIYGDEAGAVATTLKLGRTLWLIPLLIIASLIENRQGTRVSAPVFIFFFIAAATVSSLFDLPSWFIAAAGFLSKALLVLALYAVGLEVSRSTLRQFEGTAVLQGVALWAIISPASLFAIMHFT